MPKDQLETLKSIGRRQTDEHTKTRAQARKFMIRTGVYNKKGELKRNYGGGVAREPADA